MRAVQMVLKCVGNLAAGVATHKRWVYQLEERVLPSGQPTQCTCASPHAYALVKIFVCQVRDWTTTADVLHVCVTETQLRCLSSSPALP